MDLATLIQPVNLFLALVAGLSIYLVCNSLISTPRVSLGRDMEDLDATAGKRGLMASLQARLKQADLPISAEEFLGTGLMIGLVIGALLFVLTRQPVLIVMALLLGPAGYWITLEQQRDRDVRAYQDALADALDIIENTFAATPSIQAGIKDVVRYGPEVLRADFEEILTRLQAGASLEEAMAPVAARRHDLFFDMVVEALTQREKEGGSIRVVLEALASLVREQGRIYRRAMARQTQQRMEATIVCLAPLVFLVMTLILPFTSGMARPFYGSLMGQVVLVVVLIMDVVGYAWSRKIAQSGMAPERFRPRKTDEAPKPMMWN